MKGNVKLIATLNNLLAEELTAINQYMVHSELCANWGYEKLHEKIEKESIEEMRHAEWLIRRVIFLEGTPTVSKLNPMSIGKDVKEIISNDLKGEYDAVKEYNGAIKLAVEAGDNGTRDLLMTILKQEEDHVDWAEAQLSQIEQMGLQNYLARQSEGAK